MLKHLICVVSDQGPLCLLQLKVLCEWNIPVLICSPSDTLDLLIGNLFVLYNCWVLPNVFVEERPACVGVGYEVRRAWLMASANPACSPPVFLLLLLNDELIAVDPETFLTVAVPAVHYHAADLVLIVSHACLREAHSLYLPAMWTVWSNSNSNVVICLNCT